MTFTFPSTRTVMMGGASLAVLTLAVVTTQHLNTGTGPISLDPGLSRTDGYANTNTGEELRTELPVDALAEAEPAGDIASGSRETARPPAPPSPATAASPQSTSIARPTQERSQLGGAAHPLAKTEARGRLAAGDQMQAPQVRKQRAAPVEADEEMHRDTPGFQAQGDDKFEEITANPVQVTAEVPVSTFSIDVDTASYSFMRGSLMNGVLPQKDAVRIEELVNYFPYDYPAPESRQTPFATHVSVMPTPWNADTRLMHVAIKGYEITPTERPPSNLVFLLDTSGSMNAPNKLPLLINAFRLLVESLDERDTVSIVVYAGSAGTVLEPTSVSERGKILNALERLSAGGSTAGGEGIRQAYQLARDSFIQDGVNRVILATDGDFNVGISNPNELQGFIERQRDSGVYLSVMGFGRGNYNDALMQTLAQNGNGTAAYIDTLSEARKTLVEEAGSTLFPIARDVKIQVEFNPATVSEYRLIGYETRLLNREDFNNDKVDAGEIGSGHSVTALYEFTPAGAATRQIDDLRYQPAADAQSGADTDTADAADRGGEYAFVKIRYKQPEASTSQLIETPVPTQETAVTGNTASEARFAASVAAFGQLLRGGRFTGDFSYDDVIALANQTKGADPFGYRAEFVNLVRLAKSAATLERQR